MLVYFTNCDDNINSGEIANSDRAECHMRCKEIRKIIPISPNRYKKPTAVIKEFVLMMIILFLFILFCRQFHARISQPNLETSAP